MFSLLLPPVFILQESRISSGPIFGGQATGASHKTNFVIVDAVGVCEDDKTDSRPLERKKNIPFDKLIMSVALGNRDEDTLTSLAGRLARMDRELEEEDRQQIRSVAQGISLKQIINSLLDAVDPDKQVDKAKEIFNTEAPTEEQVRQATSELATVVCNLFDSPKLRDILVDLKRKSEQIIDTVSQDKLIFAGFDAQAKEKARAVVNTFETFIEENRNELTALQIIYSKPYGKRQLTYEAIRQLAEAIKKPPYNLTPELLWQAYEQLERSKVRGAGPQKLLTNIVSLIRFAIGEVDVLEPFPETVNMRFTEWIFEQEGLGREFTPEQMEWLEMIKDHIAASVSISLDHFQLTPFAEKGGAVRAYSLFGQELDSILEDLNKVLVA